MAERTKAINVRVTDDEDRMLKALAEAGIDAEKPRG